MSIDPGSGPARRVLITGAASGIGRATAAALRDRGWRVVGLDLHGSGDADGPDGGPDSGVDGADQAILACDVRDDDQVEAAVGRAVAQLGGLDAVITAAGIGLPQTATAPPGEDALAVLDVNLLGTWRTVAAALPALRRSRGRVVVIASGLVHIAFPFATAYAASKRGVTAYADQLRAEVGDLVTVTTVYPGYIRTPIHDASADAGIGLEGMVRAEPLEAAVRTLVRALEGPPRRDLATTRRSGLEYALLRLAPRALVDRVARQRVAAAARDGRFDTSTIAADMTARLRG